MCTKKWEYICEVGCGVHQFCIIYIWACCLINYVAPYNNRHKFDVIKSVKDKQPAAKCDSAAHTQRRSLSLFLSYILRRHVKKKHSTRSVRVVHMHPSSGPLRCQRLYYYYHNHHLMEVQPQMRCTSRRERERAADVIVPGEEVLKEGGTNSRTIKNDPLLRCGQTVMVLK